MRRNHPRVFSGVRFLAPPRPTRLLIGLPDGLSSAIFAKGTKGALVAFTVRAEVPPHSGFKGAQGAARFLRADTRGSGERAVPAVGARGREAAGRRSRGVRDRLLIQRLHGE